MEIKKQVPNNTITRDLSKLSAPTGNIYQSTIIISKRANQIAAEIKQELSQKLEEFSNYADTLEETFENREQIEISRYYEKLPKPDLMAISEFEEGQIYYRKIEE
jgi:DNA-directed RNA polymerase subunit K/omega